LKSNSELYDKENQEAEDIPWNFAKFLVDADGNVLKYYEPSVDLDDIRSEIEELL
jgi:glutathione peroxidase